VNVITIATGANAVRLYPNADGTGVNVLKDNNDFRNTNNTGILMCYQNSPGATATGIVQVSFSVHGSFDGVTWGTILPVTASTGCTATADGGVLKAINLMPFIRISVTTAPTATNPVVATTASFYLGW